MPQKTKEKAKEKEKGKEKAKIAKAKVKAEANLKALVETKMSNDRSKIVVIGCIEANVLVAPNAAISMILKRKVVAKDNLLALAELHLQVTGNLVRSRNPGGDHLRENQINHPVIIGCQENAKEETNATICT